MSKFLRALQKVGLVEVNDGEVTVPEPTTESAAPDTVVMDVAPVAAEPEPEASPLPAGDVVEQRPFEAIYAEQAVTSTPFSAEKLLKILDGLGALEPASRIAAVLALDSADDAWTIDDALLDAERKIRALAAARSQLQSHARATFEQARRDIDEREQRQNEAVARVRAQIGELEALLQREVTRATEEKAALESTARATKDACVREAARLDGEALRLRKIAELFGAKPGTGPAAAAPP